MSGPDALIVAAGMVILTIFGVIIGFDLGLSLAYDIGLRGACESKIVTILDCTKLPSK